MDNKLQVEQLFMITLGFSLLNSSGHLCRLNDKLNYHRGWSRSPEKTTKSWAKVTSNEDIPNPSLASSFDLAIQIRVWVLECLPNSYCNCQCDSGGQLFFYFSYGLLTLLVGFSTPKPGPRGHHEIPLIGGVRKEPPKEPDRNLLQA